MYKTILVTLDGTPTDRAIIEHVKELAKLGDGPLDDRGAAIALDPVPHMQAWANTGLAFGVVFAMTVKPGLTGALITLVVSAAIGALVARASSARGAPQLRSEAAD